MFSLKLDQSQNALTIDYGGHVNVNETKLCAQAIRIALPKMQAGFRLLVDLTELEAMDVSCFPLIGGIMEMCNAGGVAEVIRIIPDPTRDIGLQILSYFHYRSEVRIVTCSTVAQAMNVMKE
jgi:anti-anti-sigma regulatory factor